MKLLKKNYKILSFLSFWTFLMFFWYGEVRYEEKEFANLDLKYYRLMAQTAPGIHDEIEKPFAFRLLGPYLAGLLPIADPLAFKILTVLFLTVLVIVFYLFLILNQISPKIALFICILFTSNKYFFGYPAWNYFQINDLIVLIFLLLAFLAMQRKSWVRYGIYLLVGVLSREIILIMVPAAFIYMMEHHGRKKEIFFPLLASVPSVLLFIGIRLLVPSTEGNGLWEVFSVHVGKLFKPGDLFRLIINSFIPLTLIPVIYFQESKKFFLTHKFSIVFLVLVFASTLFGVDNERLMTPAFIIFYWLIAIIIQNRLTAKTTSLIIILFSCLITSLHHITSLFPLHSREYSIYLSVGIFLLLSIYIYVLKVKSA